MDNLEDRNHQENGKEGGAEDKGIKTWQALVVLVAAVLFIGVIVWLLGSGKSGSGDNAPDRVNPAANDNRAPAPVAVVQPNQAQGGQAAESTLYIPGRDQVMLAADEQSLDALMSALASRAGGVDGLIQSGKVFTAANRTRVRVLDNSSAKVKVRILEGPNIMKEGWVHERWLQ